MQRHALPAAAADADVLCALRQFLFVSVSSLAMMSYSSNRIDHVAIYVKGYDWDVGLDGQIPGHASGEGKVRGWICRQSGTVS